MYNVHLIEKSASYNQVKGMAGEWTSGTWKLSDKKAKEIIGGMVYLHTSQAGPCFLGGSILGCKKASDGKHVIRFKFNRSVVNTYAAYKEKKWGMEKLVVKIDMPKAA